MTHPLQYINATVAHQLRVAIDRIEEGQGLVVDFDYDEEVDDYMEEIGAGIEGDVSTERTVTIELEMLLPE